MWYLNKAIFIFALLVSNGLCESIDISSPQKGVASTGCMCIPMHSISPHLVARGGAANTYGVEFNRWNMLNPSCNELHPIFGYGASIGYGGQRLKVSPYLQIAGSRILTFTGAAVGPEFKFGNGVEVGVNSRFWIANFGGEMTVYQKSGVKFGVYVFIPFHQMLLLM